MFEHVKINFSVKICFVVVFPPKTHKIKLDLLSIFKKFSIALYLENRFQQKKCISFHRIPYE